MSAQPKVGELFQERYMILAKLGSGGMGSVYHARQLDNGRELALKFLHSDALKDQESIARFYREFKLLSRLVHPNIMTVYALALDEDSDPYAVCEFLKGQSLRQALGEGKLHWSRTLKIAVQAAQAVQSAHDLGILHRDLKPENILLESLPEPDFVKLIDFGLSSFASLADNDKIDLEYQKLTATGQLLGSPHYMSPEQVTAKALPESDLYALACVLFEMLKGEKLFDADTAVGVLYRHCNEDPGERIESLDPAIPTALKIVLKKALDKDPRKRQSSMAEFANELESCFSDSDAPSDRKSAKSFNSAILTACALAAIALISFFALAVDKTNKATELLEAETSGVLKQKRPEIKALSKTLHEANKLSHEHQYFEAITKYKSVIKQSKSLATNEARKKLAYQASCGLANCYEKTRDYQDAVSAWTNAISIYPGDELALRSARRLAESYARQGKTEEARAAFIKCIEDYKELNQEDQALALAYLDYAAFLADNGSHKDAIKCAQLSLKITDKLPSQRSCKGAVAASWLLYTELKRQGDLRAAKLEIEKTRLNLLHLLKTDPRVARDLMHWAEWAQKNGLSKEACPICNIALQQLDSLSAAEAALVQNKCKKILALSQEARQLNENSKP